MCLKKIYPLNQSAIPLLGVYPKEIEMCKIVLIKNIPFSIIHYSKHCMEALIKYIMVPP